MDSVVHFEIPAKDPKRAADFYTKAFGWNVSKYPDFDYWTLGTTDVDEKQMPTKPGAINGGLGQKGVMAPNAVTVTISVSDIDAALKKVAELGGKVTGPKTPVGNMGFSAYFEDTEGNNIGLWQNTMQM